MDDTSFEAMMDSAISAFITSNQRAPTGEELRIILSGGSARDLTLASPDPVAAAAVAAATSTSSTPSSPVAATDASASLTFDDAFTQFVDKAGRPPNEQELRELLELDIEVPDESPAVPTVPDESPDESPAAPAAPAAPAVPAIPSVVPAGADSVAGARSTAAAATDAGAGEEKGEPDGDDDEGEGEGEGGDRVRGSNAYTGRSSAAKLAMRIGATRAVNKQRASKRKLAGLGGGGDVTTGAR